MKLLAVLPLKDVLSLLPHHKNLSHSSGAGSVPTMAVSLLYSLLVVSLLLRDHRVGLWQCHHSVSWARCNCCAGDVTAALGAVSAERLLVTSQLYGCWQCKHCARCWRCQCCVRCQSQGAGNVSSALSAGEVTAQPQHWPGCPSNWCMLPVSGTEG